MNQANDEELLAGVLRMREKIREGRAVGADALPELLIDGSNLTRTAKRLAAMFAQHRRFLFNGNEPIQVVHENNEMPRALAVNSASVRVFCHELCVPKKWNKKRGQIRQGDA